MSVTTHYPADYAAQGGPGFYGPAIDPRNLTDETSGTMALLYSVELEAWVVADSQGNVYAQATTPVKLVDWLTEYTDSLTEALAEAEQ